VLPFVTARKWFAISAFLMLVLVAVVAVNSYNQDWKKYQRAYLSSQLTRKFLNDMLAQARQLRADADRIASSNREQAESLRQTAQHLEEKASQQDLTLWEQLNVALTAEQNLQIRKVVTETGRSADLCMTCHIDVETLIQQHEKVNFVADVASLEAHVKELRTKLAAVPKNSLEAQEIEKQLEDPERELNKLITRQFTFDSFGCTACHGGDNLGLTMKAHNEMRLDFKNIFQENLEKLHSDKWAVRQAGIERIRWMTGQDFGFSFSASKEAREEAIARAVEWWNLHKNTFLAERFGERSSPFKTENPMTEILAKRSDIAFTSAPLQYVGSATCVACHAQPEMSENYIPDSHKTHVERWFRDAFKTSQNLDVYREHPLIDPETLKTMDLTCEACHGPGSEYVTLMQKGLALDAQAMAYDAKKKQLDQQIEDLEQKLQEAETARRIGEVAQLQKQLEQLRAEAQRLGAEASTDSTRASELLNAAKEIGRCNARHNLTDPRIWALFEKLIERAGPLDQAGTGAEPDPKVALNVRCE
jgi:hypothetical protein